MHRLGCHVLRHGLRSDCVKKKPLARGTRFFRKSELCRPVIRIFVWSRLGMRIQAGRENGDLSTPSCFVWRLSRPASEVSQLLNEASFRDMGTSICDVGFAFFSRSQAILARCECMHRVERTCDAALQASGFHTCRPLTKEHTLLHFFCKDTCINQRYSCE